MLSIIKKFKLTLRFGKIFIQKFIEGHPGLLIFFFTLLNPYAVNCCTKSD